LTDKLKKNKWQEEISRQKQQYWLRGFKKQLMRAGVFFDGSRWYEGLKKFLKEGIIVSSHSMKYYSSKD